MIVKHKDMFHAILNEFGYLYHDIIEWWVASNKSYKNPIIS